MNEGRLTFHALARLPFDIAFSPEPGRRVSANGLIQHFHR